jgi:hypothetical protein
MNKEPIKEEYRCLKLTMEKSKYDFIMTAINEITQETGVNEGRALELICAEFKNSLLTDYERSNLGL